MNHASFSKLNPLSFRLAILGWFLSSLCPSVAWAQGPPPSASQGTAAPSVPTSSRTGAATLQGRLDEGAKNSGRLRPHLVPVDPAAAEDVLRYYEAPLRADGTFQLTHLAPGKYWLLARPLADDVSLERTARPLAWDAPERSKLRREAEVAKQVIELTACQRVTDFKLLVK